jgi:UDP-N-acetyl-2-amino-2-deoxyglucuronate dehydrogenase
VIIEDGQIVRRAFGHDTQPDRDQPDQAGTARPTPPGPGARPGAAADPAALDVSGHAAQIGDLLAAIGEGREPAVSGQAGRDALEIVCAVYESSRSGRTVTLGS